MFARGGMSKEALIAYIAIVCENAGGPGAFDVLEAAGIDAVSAGRVFDELAALKIVHGNTLRRVRRWFSVDAQQEHS